MLVGKTKNEEVKMKNSYIVILSNTKNPSTGSPVPAALAQAGQVTQRDPSLRSE
jgi:hypothetical protein